MNCPCCGGANIVAYNCKAAVTHWCRDCSCEWNEPRRTASRAAMGEWKRIDEAKDGTRILAYWPGGEPPIETIDWDRTFYQEVDDMPTHWMPLPPPPIAAGKGE